MQYYGRTILTPRPQRPANGADRDGPKAVEIATTVEVQRLPRPVRMRAQISLLRCGQVPITTHHWDLDRAERRLDVRLDGLDPHPDSDRSASRVIVGSSYLVTAVGGALALPSGGHAGRARPLGLYRWSVRWP